MELPSMKKFAGYGYTSYTGGPYAACSVWSSPPHDTLGDAIRKMAEYNAEKPVVTKEVKKVSKKSRRIVRVIIVDKDENVPVEQALIYKGDEIFTDKTDQELFFDLDIKGMLEKHNEKRVTFFNRAVKDRTEYLEPARVRDLEMTVVEIA